MMTQAEKKRIDTKMRQILDLLRTAGSKGRTNGELSKITYRYGGSIGDLRQLGYVIDKVSNGNGLHTYYLISEPEVEEKNIVKAYDKLVNAVKEKGLVNASELEALISHLGVTIRNKAGTHIKKVEVSM